MIEKVVSTRRAVMDETGKVTEVENAVKAESIIHAGDLSEVSASSAGVALFVANDGSLRRCTLSALVTYLQGILQGPKGDTGDTGPAGEAGKNAYQYAVEGGYPGTEAQYKELMADAASKTYVSGAIQTAITGAIGGAY